MCGWRGKRRHNVSGDNLNHRGASLGLYGFLDTNQHSVEINQRVAVGLGGGGEGHGTQATNDAARQRVGGVGLVEGRGLPVEQREGTPPAPTERRSPNASFSRA